MIEQDYNSEAQNIAMQIIAHSGEARSLAFQSLDAVHNGEFDKADELIKQANKAIGKAHDVQTSLLVDEANGKQTPFSILLVHSQDHFMTSMLAIELISEMVRMYKKYEGDQEQ